MAADLASTTVAGATFATGATSALAVAARATTTFILPPARGGERGASPVALYARSPSSSRSPRSLLLRPTSRRRMFDSLLSLSARL